MNKIGVEMERDMALFHSVEDALLDLAHNSSSHLTVSLLYDVRGIVDSLIIQFDDKEYGAEEEDE